MYRRHWPTIAESCHSVVAPVMSFRVTQCPACESTFNINPRVLETAAGKVRCGACLTVFEAAENLLASEFERDSEHESVFVSRPAGEYFDPSRFLTRQSLRDALAEQPATAAAGYPQAEHTASPLPEPRLDPEDPDTPDYLALDSSELALDTDAGIDLEDWVDPDEQEFLALVADAQQAAPDLRPRRPAAEPLAAGGYPALVEDVEALLAADPEPSTLNPAKTVPAEPLAAGGYPALETVIDDLLAESTAAAAGNKPIIPAAINQAGDQATDQAATPVQTELQQSAPGSMPLFPEHEHGTTSEYQAISEAAAPAPASPPEAFQLHVQFSISSPAYGPLLQPRHDPEPVPEIQASTGNDRVQVDEQTFNATLDEADFQNAVASNMDAANADAPDLELAADQDTGEQQATAQADMDTATPEPESPDQSIAAIRARALQSDLRDEEALEAIPEENLRSLGAFSSPVEILTGKQRRLGRQLAWASLALLAALLLSGQYLWQEMARYGQVAAVRPLYEWACSMLECALPVYNEIDAIQSSNLAVRSHPELDNALAVSIEFRNTADFAQRFPIMVLSFNSASNSVIALREFAPQEYLPPALRGRSLLPPQTPVQVNLELMDPGADAVNYTLAFRRP